MLVGHPSIKWTTYRQIDGTNANSCTRYADSTPSGGRGSRRTAGWLKATAKDAKSAKEDAGRD